MGSSPFAATGTYTRMVEVEGVDPFEIELRPLDAGDRAKIRDGLAIEREDGLGGIALGTLELLHVRQALVSWTASQPLSPATISKLKPEVLEAIREHVAWGEIPPETPPPEEPVAEEAVAALEADELRDEEEPGSVPLVSSAAAAGGGF